MGKPNKAADALSHCPLDPHLPLDSDTDRDKVNVISYPLVSEDTNGDSMITTSYSSVHEIVNCCLQKRRKYCYERGIVTMGVRIVIL